MNKVSVTKLNAGSYGAPSRQQHGHAQPDAMTMAEGETVTVAGELM